MNWCSESQDHRPAGHPPETQAGPATRAAGRRKKELRLLGAGRRSGSIRPSAEREGRQGGRRRGGEGRGPAVLRGGDEMPERPSGHSPWPRGAGAPGKQRAVLCPPRPASGTVRASHRHDHDRPAQTQFAAHAVAAGDLTHVRRGTRVSVTSRPADAFPHRTAEPASGERSRLLNVTPVFQELFTALPALPGAPTG